MSQGKTANRVLPTRRIRISRTMGVFGIALRPTILGWRLIRYRLSGRAARRAGSLLCVQTVAVCQDLRRRVITG